MHVLKNMLCSGIFNISFGISQTNTFLNRGGDRVWRGWNLGPGGGLGDELTHRFHTAPGHWLNRQVPDWSIRPLTEPSDDRLNLQMSDWTMRWQAEPSSSRLNHEMADWTMRWHGLNHQMADWTLRWQAEPSNVRLNLEMTWAEPSNGRLNLEMTGRTIKWQTEPWDDYRWITVIR